MSENSTQMQLITYNR